MRSSRAAARRRRRPPRAGARSPTPSSPPPAESPAATGQDVGERDQRERAEERAAEGGLGRPRLAEARARRVPAGVVPHHHGEPEARGPRRAPCPSAANGSHGACWRPGRRGDREDHDGHERGDGEQHRAPAHHAHAGEIQPGERPDEDQRDHPSLEAAQAGPPELQIVGEERRVHRHVHEAVEPAPPAHLEAPERAEGAAHPAHVSALVGERGRQLGHGEGDGQAPHQRGHDQEQQREAGAERRHRVLDAVRPAADVEEDDGDEGKEAELPSEPRLHCA